MNPEEQLVVGIVDDGIHTETPHGRALQRIIRDLEAYDIFVADVASPAEARTAYSNLPAVSCILVNWNLGNRSAEQQQDTLRLIRQIRSVNEDLPIFLMTEPTSEPPIGLTVDIIQMVNEYLYVMEDTPEFIAGRITAAAKRYQDRLLPPFFGELVKFSKDFEYSWHTPRPCRRHRVSGKPRPAESSSTSLASSSSVPISRSR